MTAQVWVVRNNALVLVDESGTERVPEAEEIYASLVEGRPPEAWIPVKVPGLRTSRYPLVPTLAIREEGTSGAPRFEIMGTCRGVETALAIADLQRGHTVLDGTWYPIEPSGRNEILSLVRDLGVTPGPVRSLRTFLAVRKACAAGGAVEDQMPAGAISPLAFAPPSEGVPVGVEANLYSYQLSGWRWLQFLFREEVGGILADEMGLGKTLQIISVLSDTGGQAHDPALILAPGSLLENWRRELAKFAPHLRVLKHHGPHRTGRPATLQEHDVVITSYDNAVRDNSLLHMILWRAVILDEAQFIRNPDAQRTRAVKRLRRRVGLAVTGTPIENRLMDLWSIVDFVLPGHLGQAKDFDAQFPDNVESAGRLEPLVSPLMLRRRVADVAQDLPERIDIPQVLELDDDEAAAYEAERQRISEEYGAAATLVALTSLRRFCAHPSLMNGPDGTTDPMVFSKFRRMNDIVEEIFQKGEKVIIFTSFTAMADMIARHVRTRLNAFAGVIDGRLAIDDRQPLIDQFSAVTGGGALVLNPKAGGAGLNITAANHVIHYNPEWNPALEDQASARAYRRGQRLPVTVHRLLVADTVEDVVNDRLVRKRTLSGTAVVGVEGRDEEYGDIVAALSRSPLSRTDR